MTCAFLTMKSVVDAIQLLILLQDAQEDDRKLSVCFGRAISYDDPVLKDATRAGIMELASPGLPQWRNYTYVWIFLVLGEMKVFKNPHSEVPDLVVDAERCEVIHRNAVPVFELYDPDTDVSYFLRSESRAELFEWKNALRLTCANTTNPRRAQQFYDENKILEEETQSLMSSSSALEDVRLEGWVTKLGGISKLKRSWKRRYFIIEDGELSYKKYPEQTKIRRLILDQRSVARSSTIKAFSVELWHPDKTTYFYCQNEKEKKLWLSAIRKIIELSKSRVSTDVKSAQENSIQNDESDATHYRGWNEVGKCCMCSLCGRFITVDMLYGLDGCLEQHKSCRFCLQGPLRNVLRDTELRSDDAKCPAEDCNAAYSIQDARDLLEHEEFNHYCTRLFEECIQGNNFFSCPSCKMRHERISFQADGKLVDTVVEMKSSQAHVYYFDKMTGKSTWLNPAKAADMAAYVTKELGLNGKAVSSWAQVHFLRYRFRCREANCGINFCSECKVVPYHLGYTCEEYALYIATPLP